MDPLEKQLTELSEPVPAAPLTPTVPPQAAPAAVTEEYSHEHKGHVAPMRTFSSDLANAVREKGGSVVRIAMAEEEKHRREFEESSATSKKNVFFIVASIIVIVAAIASVYYVYVYKKNSAVVAPTQTVLPSALINAETAQTIDTTGMQVADLLAAIQKIVAAPDIQSGTIKNIVVAQGTTRIPVSQFLSILRTHTSSDFVRSLSPEYMLGVYQYNTTSNLFMIVHGTAHDFLLAGMIGWEPYMFNDLVPLFNIDTSSFTPAQLQNVTFTDFVIENRDARAVLDANKKPLLFYSFLDQNTIAIAADPKTLTEIVRRF